MEDAADIGIETRRREVEGKVPDRGCSVLTDAFDALQLFHGFWKNSVKVFGNCFRCVTETKRPRVIAHTAPGNEHLAIRCLRKVSQRRKCLKEAFEGDLHARNLRLLQHDFGDEDAIRPQGIPHALKISPWEAPLVSRKPCPELFDEDFYALLSLHD